MSTFDLSKYGIKVTNVLRNAEPSILYEQALKRGEGEIVSSGALAARSGAKDRPQPKDKRIVDAEPSDADVWWGNVNIKLEEQDVPGQPPARDRLPQHARPALRRGRLRGLGSRSTRSRSASSACAYHALFMHNMLIRPTPASSRRSASPTTSSSTRACSRRTRYTNEMSSKTGRPVASSAASSSSSARSTRAR
jgi:phosphoenolpyruvate carboxykinase (ATP)